MHIGAGSAARVQVEFGALLVQIQYVVEVAVGEEHPAAQPAVHSLTC